MKLRLYQRVTLRRRYVPPTFRHDDGWFTTDRHEGPKVLQFFDEAKKAWLDVPLVIDEVKEGKW